MKSPFPGMDPYLEMFWGDVHTKLATYISDWLNPKLPGDLVARTQVYVGLYADENKEANFVPDVSFTESEVEFGSKTGAGGTALAATEPKLYRIPSPVRKQKRVVIHESSSDDRLVSVVEILSPTNKGSFAEQEAYRSKRASFLRAGVSVVEIDLLRVGTSVLYAPLEDRKRRDPADYYVCAVRGWRQGQAEVYPIPLREKLPTFRIPLRRSDPDAVLDLQALIEAAYVNGAYFRTIDYRREPYPPLAEADDKWADELLRQAGKR